MRRILVLALAAAVLAALASVAVAATKNGITPRAPKAGTTVPAGESPTFTMRVRGKGSVWVHVCKRAKKNAKGIICDDESIGQARKRGGLFRYTPKFFDYPEFWLNSPGTYYWQAHRINCTGNLKDCLREGPVVRFRVGQP